MKTPSQNGIIGPDNFTRRGMQADKFIGDLEEFLKSKPTEHELAEWLDTYSVTKVELAMVVEYLRDMERMDEVTKKMREKDEKPFRNIRNVMRAFRLVFGRRR